jgi:hypothetical protein
LLQQMTNNATSEEVSLDQKGTWKSYFPKTCIANYSKDFVRSTCGANRNMTKVPSANALEYISFPKSPCIENLRPYKLQNDTSNELLLNKLIQWPIVNNRKYLNKTIYSLSIWLALIIRKKLSIYSFNIPLENTFRHKHNVFN